MSWPSTRRLASGVALAAGTLIAAGLALSAAVNALPAAWPTGDGAVIELYTLHATGFRQLLGPYSRFGFHHPGPAMFYVLAPFYAVSGHATASLSVAAPSPSTWPRSRSFRGYSCAHERQSRSLWRCRRCS